MVAQSIESWEPSLPILSLTLGVQHRTLRCINIKAKGNGYLEIDELRTIERVEDGEKKIIVVGRSGELKITDEKTGIVIMNTNIPYGSELLVKTTKIKKGDVICKWDPCYLIISEFKGKVAFENIIKGITYREEVDEQTGFTSNH